MTLSYRAAVLRSFKAPLLIEQVEAPDLTGDNVLVRVKAAALCHTDLEMIEGALKYPVPIVLGHEVAGIVERVGPQAGNISVGDHVVLSWNPHCGHCFYCDRSQPILCEGYRAEGVKAKGYDGLSHAFDSKGRPLNHMMFIGGFGEFCTVSAQQAIAVPKSIPFDCACLIGCGVMTGVGAAMNIANITQGDTVVVIGCGAVGLSAVQGARLAGAELIIAADFDEKKRALATRLGATIAIDAAREDVGEIARQLTEGRGADVVIESAGNAAAFRLTTETVRPGGQVVWLGKMNVESDVGFRWGSLMGEKRLYRSSYGGARPRRDFPFLARSYLEGTLMLDELITGRIALDEINEGFDALRRGEALRSVITF